ncbi:MAG: hypothetical protein ACXV8O_01495 [Methylobacter sp.]
MTTDTAEQIVSRLRNAHRTTYDGYSLRIAAADEIERLLKLLQQQQKELKRE